MSSKVDADIEQRSETTGSDRNDQLVKEVENGFKDLADSQQNFMEFLKAGGHSGITDEFGKPVLWGEMSDKIDVKVASSEQQSLSDVGKEAVMDAARKGAGEHFDAIMNDIIDSGYKPEEAATVIAAGTASGLSVWQLADLVGSAQVDNGGRPPLSGDEMVKAITTASAAGMAAGLTGDQIFDRAFKAINPHMNDGAAVTPGSVAQAMVAGLGPDIVKSVETLTQKITQNPEIISQLVAAGGGNFSEILPGINSLGPEAAKVIAATAEAGWTPEDLSKLVAAGGGNLTPDAAGIIAAGADAGWSPKDISRIVAGGGGNFSPELSKVIAAAAEANWPAEHVGRLVATANLRDITGDGKPDVTPEVADVIAAGANSKWSAEQVYNLVAAGGGNFSQEAAQIIAAGGKAGWRPDHVAKLVAAGGGNFSAEATKIIAAGAEAGWIPKDIAKLVAAGGGNFSESAAEVIAAGAEAGWKPQQIAELVAAGGGNFSKVEANIIAAGGGNFKPDQVLSLVAAGGGNLTPEAVDVIAAGAKFGWNQEQLTKLVAAGGGNFNMEQVRIIAAGGGNWSPEHVLDLVAAGGGNLSGDNIAQIIAAGDKLAIPPSAVAEQVFEYLSHNGGTLIGDGAGTLIGDGAGTFTIANPGDLMLEYLSHNGGALRVPEEGPYLRVPEEGPYVSANSGEGGILGHNGNAFDVARSRDLLSKGGAGVLGTNSASAIERGSAEVLPTAGGNLKQGDLVGTGSAGVLPQGGSNLVGNDGASSRSLLSVDDRKKSFDITQKIMANLQKRRKK